MPPPSPATHASTRMPNRSSPRRTATTAPESAKTKTPMTSSTAWVVAVSVSTGTSSQPAPSSSRVLRWLPGRPSEHPTPERRPGKATARHPHRLARMADLTRDDVAHLAGLARIDLSDAELDKMVGELAVILESVATVQQAPIADVEPMSHPMPIVNVTRPDVVRPSLSPQAALSGRPRERAAALRRPAHPRRGLSSGARAPEPATS